MEPPSQSANERLSWLQNCLRLLALDREAECFRCLFGHFHPRLVTFFLRRGMSPVGAEDTAQEVMLLVWDNAGAFNGDVSVSAWVFGLARELAAEQLRLEQQREAVVVLLPEVPVHRELPEDNLADAEEELRLYAAMQVLAQRDVQLVHEAFLDGVSHRQLAERHGRPVGSVKSRIRKSIAKLREVMGGQRP